MMFKTALENGLVQANGVFEDIPWITMNGAKYTFGTMTDEHVANSRHYHKHMAEVARVAPELRIDVETCINYMKFMDMIIDRRIAANIWTMNASDFRLAQ